MRIRIRIRECVLICIRIRMCVIRIRIRIRIIYVYVYVYTRVCVRVRVYTCTLGTNSSEGGRETAFREEETGRGPRGLVFRENDPTREFDPRRGLGSDRESRSRSWNETMPGIRMDSVENPHTGTEHTDREIHTSRRGEIIIYTFLEST